MKQRLRIKLDLEVFQPQELEEVKAEAERKRGVIYTWKANNKANWLEYGATRVDAIGFVVLPTYLSDAFHFPARHK